MTRYFDLKLIIWAVLAAQLVGSVLTLLAAQPPAPAPKDRELVLVYLAPTGTPRAYLAPECPSGPYEVHRFSNRAELDAFVAREKPFVFAVLTRVTEDAGVWTAWAPCANRLTERKEP